MYVKTNFVVCSILGENLINLGLDKFESVNYIFIVAHPHRAMQKIIATAYYHACQHVLTNTRCSHHCCILFQGDEILSITTNHPDTHAEIGALQNYCPQCD